MHTLYYKLCVYLLQNSVKLKTNIDVILFIHLARYIKIEKNNILYIYKRLFIVLYLLRCFKTKTFH